MRGQDGATAVEFSLIATLLFMLLFGILQFGLVYNVSRGSTRRRVKGRDWRRSHPR